MKKIMRNNAIIKLHKSIDIAGENEFYDKYLF